MAREKILIVDQDINNLSKLYLALVHRKFKTEACNNPEEITQRLKRFKPVVIVLNFKEYQAIGNKLRIPAIVMTAPENANPAPLNYGDILLHKPIHASELIKAIEQLI